MACEITGDATIMRDQDGDLHWERADPEIHVHAELLDEADERGMAFLTAKYEIGEWCPHHPHTRHGRLRPP